MKQQNFILSTLFVFCFNNFIFAQIFTPESFPLLQNVSKYIYSNKFDSAQSIVLEYLETPELTNKELFYGHFLFADIVKSSGNIEKSINFLQKSRKYLKNINNKTLYESLVYGNIGECYFTLQDYPNATKNALLSVKTSPDSSLRGGGHSINHQIIGFSYFLKKNYKTALKYYYQAIDEYIEYDHLCELPLCYIKIAKVYMATGDNILAEKFLDKSLLLSDSCTVELYTILTKQTLLDYYKLNARFEEALNTLSDINLINRKQQNEKERQKINELELIYETKITKTENKNLIKRSAIEAENNSIRTKTLITSIIGLSIILLLVLFILRIRDVKNKALNKKVIKIEAQKAERETLLKEVHHRVKNNLQVITSLLSLQSSYIENSRIKEMFSHSQHRINSMAMVHEMLYQSENLSQINFNSYLMTLADYLVLSTKGSNNNINLTIDILAIPVKLSIAIPLGLMVNEILTNALSHGIKGDAEGEITIKLDKNSSNKYSLTIGDNGVGCPENITFHNSPSLGLRLMYKLARQLNGSIEKIPSLKGCHYKIDFEQTE